MNAPAAVAVAAAFGTILEGGFYAGRIRMPDGEYAVIAALKTGAIVKVGNVRHVIMAGLLGLVCDECGASDTYHLGSGLEADRFIASWDALLKRHEHGRGAA